MILLVQVVGNPLPGDTAYSTDGRVAWTARAHQRGRRIGVFSTRIVTIDEARMLGIDRRALRWVTA